MMFCCRHLGPQLRNWFKTIIDRVTAFFDRATELFHLAPYPSSTEQPSARHIYRMYFGAPSNVKFYKGSAQDSAWNHVRAFISSAVHLSPNDNLEGNHTTPAALPPIS